MRVRNLEEDDDEEIVNTNRKSKKHVLIEAEDFYSMFYGIYSGVWLGLKCLEYLFIGP